MKKLALALFYIILFTASTFAQENKLTIGLYGGASLSRLNGIDERSSSTSPFQVSSQYGITLEYYVSEKVMLSTGLGALNLKLKTNYNFRTIEKNDPSVPVETIYNYDYLNIPITIGYTILDGDFKLIPHIGFLAGIKRATSSSTLYMNGAIYEDVSYTTTSESPVLLSGMVSLEGRYYFSNNFSMNFTPQFIQSISRFYTRLGDVRYFAMGINLGLNYHI